MPNFNGTGPSGYGPGTGGGRGPCGGGGMGWRRGWGRGQGRGWFGRFWGQPPITKREESEVLSGEEEDLEQELKAIKERLAQLKGKK